MSYRLKFDEPVDKGWRRIVHEQIASSIVALSSGSDRATAIHETRKSMKRVRALLKLLRSGLSDDDYARENRRYSDIGRLLSTARDTTVLIATATDLSNTIAGKPRAVALSLVEDARRTARRIAAPRSGRPGSEAEHVTAAIQALKKAAKAVDRLELRSTSFAVVRRGLAKSYRKGRIAMHHAYEENDDEAYHEWRKAVQAHWRHMALVSRAWPDLFAARMVLAKEMSDLLGDDHDLSALMQSLKKRSTQGRKTPGTDGLIEAALARQQSIREQLKAKGEALYAEDTDVFVERVETYWKAAKDARKLQRKSSRKTRQETAAVPVPAPKPATRAKGAARAVPAVKTGAGSQSRKKVARPVV